MYSTSSLRPVSELIRTHIVNMGVAERCGQQWSIAGAYSAGELKNSKMQTAIIG